MACCDFTAPHLPLTFPCAFFLGLFIVPWVLLPKSAMLLASRPSHIFFSARNGPFISSLLKVPSDHLDCHYNSTHHIILHHTAFTCFYICFFNRQWTSWEQEQILFTLVSALGDRKKRSKYVTRSFVENSAGYMLPLILSSTDSPTRTKPNHGLTGLSSLGKCSYDRRLLMGWDMEILLAILWSSFRKYIYWGCPKDAVLEWRTRPDTSSCKQQRVLIPKERIFSLGLIWFGLVTCLES